MARRLLALVRDGKEEGEKPMKCLRSDHPAAAKATGLAMTVRAKTERSCEPPAVLREDDHELTRNRPVEVCLERTGPMCEHQFAETRRSVGITAVRKSKTRGRPMLNKSRKSFQVENSQPYRQTSVREPARSLPPTPPPCWDVHGPYRQLMVRNAKGSKPLTLKVVKKDGSEPKSPGTLKIFNMHIAPSV